MADQEVIKHTKKVYKIWTSKEHSPWQKAKEFFLEVLIIVFAVSLSIWLHGLSEHSHQQKEVKDFLVGLKKDLNADLAEMRADKKSYDSLSKAVTYFSKLKKDKIVSKDSLKPYVRYLFNYVTLNPNDGRYEGFKSSGKLGNIENQELQNSIVNLYQEDLVALKLSTDLLLKQKDRLVKYVAENRARTSDDFNNLSIILQTDKAYFIVQTFFIADEIIDRYNLCINKMNEIIAEIDKEYDLKN